MGRVIHFEIHAEDPDRAMKFYTNCFGWEFKKWEGPFDYWLIMTGSTDKPGIDGGMLNRKGNALGESVISYICTLDVESIENTEKIVKENGGEIANPRMSVPKVGWLTYFKDTEGNIFGAMQSDSSAN